MGGLQDLARTQRAARVGWTTVFLGGRTSSPVNAGIGVDLMPAFGPSGINGSLLMPTCIQHNAPDVSDPLLSLARSRELLGVEAEGMTDEQLGLVTRHAALLARLLVEMFLDTRQQKR